MTKKISHVVWFVYRWFLLLIFPWKGVPVAKKNWRIIRVWIGTEWRDIRWLGRSFFMLVIASVATPLAGACLYTWLAWRFVLLPVYNQVGRIADVLVIGIAFAGLLVALVVIAVALYFLGKYIYCLAADFTEMLRGGYQTWYFEGGQARCTEERLKTEAARRRAQVQGSVIEIRRGFRSHALVFGPADELWAARRHGDLVMLESKVSATDCPTALELINTHSSWPEVFQKLRRERSKTECLNAALVALKDRIRERQIGPSPHAQAAISDIEFVIRSMKDGYRFPSPEAWLTQLGQYGWKPPTNSRHAAAMAQKKQRRQAKVD